MHSAVARLCLVSIVLVVGSTLCAQTTRQPIRSKSSPSVADDASTRIEAFKAQREKLIITDVVNVAKVPDVGLGVEIKAIALYEPSNESQKVKGVEFVLYGHSTAIVRVDLDEIPEIRRACSFLYEFASKVTDREEARAEYVSRSGLSIGLEKRDGGEIQAVLYNQGALVPLPVLSLVKIGEALKEATNILNP